MVYRNLDLINGGNGEATKQGGIKGEENPSLVDATGLSLDRSASCIYFNRNWQNTGAEKRRRKGERHKTSWEPRPYLHKSQPRTESPKTRPFFPNASMCTRMRAGDQFAKEHDRRAG